MHLVSREMVAGAELTSFGSNLHSRMNLFNSSSTCGHITDNGVNNASTITVCVCVGGGAVIHRVAAAWKAGRLPGWEWPSHREQGVEEERLGGSDPVRDRQAGRTSKTALHTHLYSDSLAIINCWIHKLSLPLWTLLAVAAVSHTRPHSHTPSGPSREDCRSQTGQPFSAPERSEFKHKMYTPYT